jgi:threonine/homoserine/homoserine lactone efflux protein
MTGALAICAVALAVAFLGSMPLAGPISVMTLSRAASGRFGEAFRIGLGAAVAEGIYAGLAFWGFATILPQHRLVAPISQGATSILLVVLGARFVFWQPPTERADPRESKAGTLFLGFSISALNPTLLVTWTAVVAFLYSRGVERHSGIFAIPLRRLRSRWSGRVVRVPGQDSTRVQEQASFPSFSLGDSIREQVTEGEPRLGFELLAVLLVGAALLVLAERLDGELDLARAAGRSR